MNRLFALVAAVVLVANSADAARAETLYGANFGTDELLTINTSTGAATPVGLLGFTSVFGLAFDPFISVPEPSSLMFLAMTAVCMVGYGWRKKRQVA